MATAAGQYTQWYGQPQAAAGAPTGMPSNAFSGWWNTQAAANAVKAQDAAYQNMLAGEMAQSQNYVRNALRQAQDDKMIQDLMGQMGLGQQASGPSAQDQLMQQYLQLEKDARAKEEQNAKRTGQAAGVLYEQYDKAYKNARQANEQRFGEILGGYRGRYDEAEGRLGAIQQGYGDRYKEAMSTLGQISNQDRIDANRRYDQLGAKTTRSAMDRGLYNTTVLDSLQRGVESDRSAELRRISDQRLNQQLGYQTNLSGDSLNAAQQAQGTLSNLSGDTLQFLERREDEYPDLGMITQLGLQAGQAGALPGQKDGTTTSSFAAAPYGGANAPGTQTNAGIYGGTGSSANYGAYGSYPGSNMVLNQPQGSGQPMYGQYGSPTGGIVGGHPLLPGVAWKPAGQQTPAQQQAMATYQANEPYRQQAQQQANYGNSGGMVSSNVAQQGRWNPNSGSGQAMAAHEAQGSMNSLYSYYGLQAPRAW